MNGGIACVRDSVPSNAIDTYLLPVLDPNYRIVFDGKNATPPSVTHQHHTLLEVITAYKNKIPISSVPLSACAPPPPQWNQTMHLSTVTMLVDVLLISDKLSRPVFSFEYRAGCYCRYWVTFWLAHTHRTVYGSEYSRVLGKQFGRWSNQIQPNQHLLSSSSSSSGCWNQRIIFQPFILRWAIKFERALSHRLRTSLHFLPHILRGSDACWVLVYLIFMHQLQFRCIASVAKDIAPLSHSLSACVSTLANAGSRWIVCLIGSNDGVQRTNAR